MVTTIPLATNEIPKGDKAPLQLQGRLDRLGGIVQAWRAQRCLENTSGPSVMR